MKSITNKEADEWIGNMKPEQIRQVVQQWHALKQGLCAQILLVPTGADDWVERSIATGDRLRRAENALRKLVSEVEASCIGARNEARNTTCTNCMGRGETGGRSCCVCHGTALRAFV